MIDFWFAFSDCILFLTMVKF